MLETSVNEDIAWTSHTSRYFRTSFTSITFKKFPVEVPTCSFSSRIAFWLNGCNYRSTQTALLTCCRDLDLLVQAESSVLRDEDPKPDSHNCPRKSINERTPRLCRLLDNFLSSTQNVLWSEKWNEWTQIPQTILSTYTHHANPLLCFSLVTVMLSKTYPPLQVYRSPLFRSMSRMMPTSASYEQISLHCSYRLERRLP